MGIDLLVLQHSPWEGPGGFLKEAAKRSGVFLHVVKVWQQPLPEVSWYRGMIILGGGANVDEEDRYPFLVPKKN